MDRSRRWILGGLIAAPAVIIAGRFMPPPLKQIIPYSKKFAFNKQYGWMHIKFFPYPTDYEWVRVESFPGKYGFLEKGA